MTQPSISDNDTPRRSRARRRETMISAVATVLGCLALVIMIATVVRVVMIKLWESARVNPDYVQSVYADTLEHKWSGNSRSPSALLGSSQPKTDEATLPLSVTATSTPSTTVSESAPSLERSELASPQPPIASTPTLSAIQNIESKRAAIEFTIRSFFAAADVTHKLAFARDPTRVRPLMEKYYLQHPQPHREWRSLGWVLPVNEPGYSLGYAQAIFTNAEPVSLIIEEMADGTFRVDWESSVRYSEVDWNEFIKTQPADPKLFRVIASKPRNTPSDAPKDTEVLEIKHPDDDDVIYACFDRRDPKFQPLIQQLQSGNWKDVPLTLRLCYPGPASSGSSTARIADVEGKGWLILHGTRS